MGNSIGLKKDKILQQLHFKSIYDFRSACVATRYIMNESDTHYNYPKYSAGVYDMEFITSVMMVTRCSSNVVNTTLLDLCENSEVHNTVVSFLPVSDSVLTYRNRYCAYCNGMTDDNLTDWTLELYCDIDLSFTRPILDVVRRRKCNIFYYPPEFISANQCYLLTRNDTNPGCITTLHATYIQDNDTYDRLCLPGQERSFDVISQHQYMCFSCEMGYEISDFKSECYLPGNRVTKDLSPPFTAILDPSVLQSMADDANTDHVKCDPATQFEDLKMVIP